MNVISLFSGCLVVGALVISEVELSQRKKLMTVATTVLMIVEDDANRDRDQAKQDKK